MGSYAAGTYPQGYELISAVFWGVSILVVLFAFCALAWKAAEWVRDRRHPDAVAEDGQPEDTDDPLERAISRPPGDYYDFAGNYGDELGGLGSMTQREQEELFSIYAPRKVRKAMKARKRARERRQRR